jgi:hypothetical protein
LRSAATACRSNLCGAGSAQFRRQQNPRLQKPALAAACKLARRLRPWSMPPLRLSGRHLDPEENANGGGKKGQKYDAGRISLRRYDRELGIDQIELVLNFVKIDAQKAIF